MVLLVLAFAGCAAERDRGGPSDDEGVHPAGILDPTSEDFHGAELAARGWDLDLCADCHGTDFTGGASGVSCTSCHTNGPTACDTCHAAVPTSGAHGNHAAAVGCDGCHVVPARWDDPGHVRTGGVADPWPPEVTMTGLAAMTIEPADRPGPPVFEAGTCKNVYCHGSVLGPAGGVNTTPAWAPAPPATCDRCHGAPPPTHATADCATCHPTPATDARHLDGAIDIGRIAGVPACSGCHGGATSAAPPVDLDGDTLVTALGVGAHQAHLQGPRRIAPPIACETCHVVPATITAAGHLDSAQPAEVASALGWDRTSQTCATAACHGPARPAWTSTGEVFCGSCHGVPPVTAPHTPGMPLTACIGCHPNTVDAFGNIVIADGPSGPTSEHLDGEIDAP